MPHLVVFRIPLLDQFLLHGTQSFVCAVQFVRGSRSFVLSVERRHQQKCQRTRTPPEHLLLRRSVNQQNLVLKFAGYAYFLAWHSPLACASSFLFFGLKDAV